MNGVESFHICCRWPAYGVQVGEKRKVSVGEYLYERGKALAFYLPRKRITFPPDSSELTLAFTSESQDCPDSAQQVHAPTTHDASCTPVAPLVSQT